MHAAYPFVVIWDDHEVEDNYAGKQPDSASTDPEPLREQQQLPAAGPVRPAAQERLQGVLRGDAADPAHRSPNRLYGSFRLGKMAELFLTDERQYRDQQPCDDVQLQACPEDMDPGRTFLGDSRRPG